MSEHTGETKRRRGRTPETPERSRPSDGARVVALDALVRIEDGAYAHVIVPAMLGQTNLSDRDRAFATDLTYGTVRAQRRIDDLIAHVVKRPLHRLDPPVRAALRLGAYQLLNDTPPHAAVASTVDAVGARSPRARGFVNANLRALTRLPRPFPEPQDDAVALSYPDWLVERLTAELGAKPARAALVAMNEPAAVTLRPDPRQVTVDALTEELRAAGAEVEPGKLVRDALLVRGLGDPARLPAVRDGRATPQDQGSQAVVLALAPTPGERVADLAAAPGGKATAIAELVGSTGSVVALDLDAGRVRMIDGARHRIGLPHLFPVVGDATRPPLRAGTFDRVLLDAPCSGIGVLRRRPDARWRLRAEAIGELATLQRDLMAAAAPLVRPGGILVYSVCTLTTEETLGVDQWAAAHLPDLVPVAPPGAPWTPRGRGALLLPQTAGTDGMFVLVLRCAASSVTVMKLAPSILSADFAELGAEVERVSEVADLLHVDVMDGHFVPNLTIGPPVVKSLRKRTELFLDCHLMVDNPGVLLEEFADAGADRCIVHIELGDPRPLFDALRARNVGVGLVLNPPTPVDTVLPYLDQIDLLLVMSVNPGWGGQAFIPEVLDKVAVARKEIDARGLAVEIEIDGGINVDTAGAAAAAGCDILVAGSAVFRAPDPVAASRAILAAAHAARA